MTTPCRRSFFPPVRNPIEPTFEWADPPAPREEPQEPGEPEEDEVADVDDADWEAFLADDDERDPLPERGDFWTDVPDE